MKTTVSFEVQVLVLFDRQNINTYASRVTNFRREARVSRPFHALSTFDAGQYSSHYSEPVSTKSEAFVRRSSTGELKQFKS